MEGNDFEILRDNTDAQGVRHIIASPSCLVCSELIEIDICGDTIERVAFHRGCDGNAKGIAALARGMKTGEVISRLCGITCGNKPTSCPDQLARILAHCR